jgi:hypothetical protein
MRGEEHEEYSPFSRRNMYTAPGVERTDAEGDPDLPRYGEFILFLAGSKLTSRRYPIDDRCQGS